MADNSQRLLDDVLSQQRLEIAPTLSDQEYFEVFCAAQLLKNFDLSYEEIEEGVVDGEHDGGVDAVYSFVDGELVLEDFDVTPFKKDVIIELHVIQSKTSGGFSEGPINKLISVTKHLLRLDADYEQLSQYNSDVKAAFDNFRKAYRGLAARFPALTIHFYYSSKRAEVDVHANLQVKAEELKAEAAKLFPGSIVNFKFVGARKLLELARQRPKTTYEIRVSRNLSAPNGYIVLSPLTAYAQFLRHTDGAVRSELFESNVRDFQGTTEVNADIAKTIASEKEVDFWWMNNGVTILSSRATLNGDIVTVENPQIVNGLQTSTQIARHPIDPQDARSVMIKIIASEDEETRDKIIKATNSQNPVQPATLRATDKVQRDIEEALKSAGLFYDRRKNFYRNEGKSPDKIISIPLMTQAVVSIILGLPNSARARPSSLIKDNEMYGRVFSESYPIGLYVNAALLMRAVDKVLRTRSEFRGRDKTNLRFYVLSRFASMLTEKPAPTASDIAKIDAKLLDENDIESAIDKVATIYAQLGSSDQAAKGTELRRRLAEETSAEIKSSKLKG